jgi:hypothetical protein
MRRPSLERTVLDVVFLGVTVAFFVMSIGYVAVCDQLSK